MVKILFIVPRFGSIHRGLETFVKELISHLSHSNFNITILSSHHEENFESVVFKNANILYRENFDFLFKYKALRKFWSLFNLYGSSDFESVSLLFNSLSFFKKSKFDIIIPFGGYWSFFLFKYSLFRNGAKIISIGQASVVKREILLSDFFVALTPYAYDEALAFFPISKIVLIPNGVDNFKFKTNENCHENVILCVAAFTFDKNHIALLNAFEFMSTEIKLILVGTGPLLEDLRSHPVCKSHNVIFRSAKLDDMPEIYSSASIFTLASVEEAFGIVFLEALSSGLNVVCHNAPRQRYVVGNSGFFCDVNNPQDYSNALKCAMSLNRKELNILHASQFSWGNIAKMYEVFFLQCVR